MLLLEPSPLPLALWLLVLTLELLPSTWPSPFRSLSSLERPLLPARSAPSPTSSSPEHHLAFAEGAFPARKQAVEHRAANKGRARGV